MHQVFLDYLAEQIEKWVPHSYIEDHQLLSRNRSIAAVGAAPAGERLDVLVDWSEKLALEPNDSSTGAQYNKIGLIIAVCVYRSDQVGSAQAETLVGVCEKPVNDVPHTQVFLKRVVKHFADRSLERGTKLTAVNIWSDGGPAHFKCAEAFVYNSHLARYLQIVSGNSAATLTWNFMQSYHGKGPYDAEGGLIKYRIRRAIYKGGVAFTSGWGAFQYCCRDSALTDATARRAGTDVLAAFSIVRRTFFYIAENEVACFRYCTSPLFLCTAARGAAANCELKFKGDVYCMRPDPNPEVVVFECQPVKLGLPRAMHPEANFTSQPYQPETLNLIPGPTGAGFTGQWRMLSCSCKACLFHGHEAGAEASCSSYGPSVLAPVWECYKTTRKPPTAALRSPNREASFLVVFVDCSIASCLLRGQTLQQLTDEIASFLRYGLCVYKSQRGGNTLVKERFKKPNWLQRWVRDMYRASGDDQVAWSARRLEIGNTVSKTGWEPPAQTLGPQRNAHANAHANSNQARVLQFIDSCIL